MSLTQKAKELLEKHHTRPIKSLGQNFLINEAILEKIAGAGEIQPEDYVIEIGPGLGFLTQLLAEKSKYVLVTELDSKMVQVLTHEMPQHVKILNQDALKTDWQKELQDIGWKGQKVKIVANLPYYITTPILFMFLEGDLPVNSMVMMMQKEVADRIKAKPGGKDYGALSVAVQYRCNVDIVCNVSGGSFLPPPDVESSVVRFNFKENKAEPIDEKLFIRVVRGAFAQRRKNLRNTMSNIFPELKNLLPDLMKQIDILPERRGETLTVSEFIKLSDAIYETLHEKK